jgi:hypothetical protein
MQQNYSIDTLLKKYNVQNKSELVSEAIKILKIVAETTHGNNSSKRITLSNELFNANCSDLQNSSNRSG